MATKAHQIASQHPTPHDRSLEWACVGADPRIFDPDNVIELANAKSYCVACPARLVCLQLGLQRQEWGVWGGVLLEAGKRLNAPRRPGWERRPPEPVALG